MIQPLETFKSAACVKAQLKQVKTAIAIRTAKISEFRAPTPKILFGQGLKEITDLEKSIAKYGLMTPLKVTRANDKFIVIDGRKRLTALRRMRFKNTLPRSLVNVPFVMSTEPVPHVKSAQDQYRDFIALLDSGLSRLEAAQTLCISETQMRALTKIQLLSPTLKSSFLSRAISLEQACAFAALPSHTSQNRLLLDLGPFAAPRDILIEIEKLNRKTQDHNCSFILDNKPKAGVRMKPPALTYSARVAA